MTFNKCPTEVIEKIGGFLDNASVDQPSKRDLYSFCLVNKKCYEVGIRDLYHSYEYYGYNALVEGEKLEKFIRSLIENPKLGALIRRLSLHKWHMHYNIWPVEHKEKRSMYTGHDKGDPHYNLVGWFLMSQATSLRYLLVEYPQEGKFLSLCPPTLQDLEVLKRRFHMYDMLDLHFLPKVLQLPNLKSLCLRAKKVQNNRVSILPSTVAHRTSTLQHLTIRSGNISQNALASLLQSVKALNTFVFQAVANENEPSDSFDEDISEDSPGTIPRTSWISLSLRNHSSSLEALTLCREDGRWTPSMDEIGSLRHFTSLKHLSVAATMLLGWNHCEHFSSSSSSTSSLFDLTYPLPPSELATLLPPTLETLDLQLDEQHEDRNGTNYVYSIVQSLLNAQDQIPKLKSITISTTGSTYCPTCKPTEDADPDDACMTDMRSRYISIQEIVRIRNLLQQTEPDFRHKWDILDWDGYDGTWWDQDNVTMSYLGGIFPDSVTVCEYLPLELLEYRGTQ